MADNIRKFPVQPFLHYLICEKPLCNGEMECVATFPMAPPSYQHQCTLCGERKTTMDKYPLIKFETPSGKII